MLCAIWTHLYDLENVKDTQGGGLLLVKLQEFSSVRWKRFKNFGKFTVRHLGMQSV